MGHKLVCNSYVGTGISFSARYKPSLPAVPIKLTANFTVGSLTKAVFHSKDRCLHFFYRKFNFEGDLNMITVKLRYDYWYCLRMPVQYTL